MGEAVAQLWLLAAIFLVVLFFVIRSAVISAFRQIYQQPPAAEDGATTPSRPIRPATFHFRIKGKHRQTGEVVEMELEAANRKQAEALAAERGVRVDSVALAPAATTAAMILLCTSIGLGAVKPAASLPGPPASVPATQRSEAEQLRAIIVGLRQQIADLKEENAKLRRQLAKAPKSPPLDASIEGKTISKDMTEAQVRELLGEPQTQTRTDDGVTVATWTQHAWEDAQPDVVRRGPLTAVDPLSVMPGEGQVRVKTIRRQITVWFRDGRVERFTDTRGAKSPGDSREP